MYFIDMKRVVAVITLIACLALACSCQPMGGNEDDIKDGYLLFGEYPQTVKAVDVTITDTVDHRGYYLGSDGAYYAKREVTPFGNSAVFSNEEVGFEGDVFYFKVEPIRWRVVSEYKDSLTLLCDSILYGSVFNSSGRNNYAESDVRKSLNEDFYNVAFSDGERVDIMLSGVDNSPVTTAKRPNYHCCGDTEDYLYLLSYADALNTNYGLDNIDNRKIKATDYAKATGSSNYWWLRSPDSSWDDNAWYVTTSGSLRCDGWTTDNVNRSVTGTQGVVPAMKIKYE